MSRFVAFLRGMNLGRRRITNDELCSCFTRMGFEDVSAFLASGNVIFRPGELHRRDLAGEIERGLQLALEYQVPTFLRSAAEVRAIAALAPFTADQLADSGKAQVMMLPGAPDPEAGRSVLDLATEDDRLVLDGTELYWLPRASILDTALDLKFIEREIGPTTTRTFRTLERLALKLDKLGPATDSSRTGRAR